MDNCIFSFRLLIVRTGDILNVRTEKLPEVLLSNALFTTAKQWTTEHITDYTSVENLYVETITGTSSYGNKHFDLHRITRMYNLLQFTLYVYMSDKTNI